MSFQAPPPSPLPLPLFSIKLPGNGENPPNSSSALRLRRSRRRRSVSVQNLLFLSQRRRAGGAGDKKRDRNDQKNVSVFFWGGGERGRGCLECFSPSGKQQNAGKKGKKTARKSRGKGKKKRGFNQKRPVCTQNALRRFRQGFEEKTPRFGECREVRVDLISFFWGGWFLGGGGGFGVFSALSAAASGRSQQHPKEAFLPQSEAGRAGRWLRELSLGKKNVKPPKTPRGEGLEQAWGEGTIIMFSGFFSKTSSRNG